MAFDTDTRKKLAQLVTDCRRLLEEEFSRQLEGTYGIREDGEIVELEQLTNLTDAQLSVAGILRQRIEHLRATDPSGGKPGEMVLRVIREQAFTLLNRFAALRMAEARELILEAVAKGDQSQGFQVYDQITGPVLGERFERYRCFLFSLFDELSIDLGVLFDRFSPQGMLFPCEACLRELLENLNRNDLSNVWSADETIGWIYQYWNSKEERKAMRAASNAPRNSRELYARNQFFTPRYVVEFLTDNTLGRIWYEMTQGETSLNEQCRYLVRRPNEIFLAEGEYAPEQPEQEGLSQEELLKQPVHVPHRPFKDPREIRLLDPACGSMHFGLYAFDLFEVIYEEAWDQDIGSLRQYFSEKDALLREVPRLIIENNLHGVDIDPRCTQIAGLALWLRAQRAWHGQNLKAVERPQIRKSNVVCAEPMPGDPDQLEAFTSKLHPALAQMVERIFENMKLAGEAGTLLKIEEEIQSLVETARETWKEQQRKPELFTDRDLGLATQDEIDLSGVSSTRFFNEAEERIYKALEKYAEGSEGDTGGYRRKLFADDAAQGFAFIDLCRKGYDVVLMNPAFGDASHGSRSYLSNSYPVSKHDLAAAFVERAFSLTKDRGSIGCISTRTLFFLPTSEKWRKKIFPMGHLGVFADLGLDVMDAATVYAAAYTFSKRTDGDCMFFRGTDWLQKQEKLSSAIERIEEGGSDPETYVRDISIYNHLPRWVIPYYLPANLSNIFSRFHSLGKLQHGAKQGLATGDDFRFARSWSEVAPNSIISLEADSSQSAYIDETANRQAWVPYAKGGSFSPFYPDLGLVVKWNDNGHEIRNFSDPKTGNELSRYRGAKKYFLPGLTFTYRSRRFGVGAMPSGAVFGVTGMGVFLEADRDYLLEAMAVMNSSPFNFLLFMLCERRDPLFQAGKINSVPWPLKADSTELTELAVDGYRDSACSRSLVETSPHFTMPFFMSSVGVDNLCHLLNEEDRLSLATESRWIDRQQNIDLLVSELYGIDEEAFVALRAELVQFLGDDNHDCLGCPTARSGVEVVSCMLSHLVGTVFGRWDIRYATGERQPPELPDPFDPLPVCPPGMLQNANGLPTAPTDIPADYPLRISWPGILVDDHNHPEDVVARTHEALEVIWKDRAEGIEEEACQILKVKSLRDYFGKPAKFFADHLKRYSKSRRQAPLYCPLSTASGSYTLWVYYHRMDDQLLYKAINDFVEPKLESVSKDLQALRSGERQDSSRLEKLSDLELELKDFREELLRLAPIWKPDLNDGVLITASPLWKLFLHKPWQKKLKETWGKLEKGDFDWAHLAHSFWPDRVREKCESDKSLAIAHDLEDLFEG
jgi:hypothetical protein